MQELYRILQPGGTAILQIPQDLEREKTFEDDSITDPKERAKIFGQYDHVRVYGRDYFDKLRSIGFKVEEVESHFPHGACNRLINTDLQKEKSFRWQNNVN